MCYLCTVRSETFTLIFWFMETNLDNIISVLMSPNVCYKQFSGCLHGWVLTEIRFIEEAPQQTYFIIKRESSYLYYIILQN
jgi:hypothetical protein